MPPLIALLACHPEPGWVVVSGGLDPAPWVAGEKWLGPDLLAWPTADGWRIRRGDRLLPMRDVVSVAASSDGETLAWQVGSDIQMSRNDVLLPSVGCPVTAAFDTLLETEHGWAVANGARLVAELDEEGCWHPTAPGRGQVTAGSWRLPRGIGPLTVGRDRLAYGDVELPSPPGVLLAVALDEEEAPWVARLTKSGVVVAGWGGRSWVDLPAIAEQAARIETSSLYVRDDRVWLSWRGEGERGSRLAVWDGTAWSPQPPGPLGATVPMRRLTLTRDGADRLVAWADGSARESGGWQPIAERRSDDVACGASRIDSGGFAWRGDTLVGRVPTHPDGCVEGPDGLWAFDTWSDGVRAWRESSGWTPETCPLGFSGALAAGTGDGDVVASVAGRRGSAICRWREGAPEILLHPATEGPIAATVWRETPITAWADASGVWIARWDGAWQREQLSTADAGTPSLAARDDELCVAWARRDGPAQALEIRCHR